MRWVRGRWRHDGAIDWDVRLIGLLLLDGLDGGSGEAGVVGHRRGCRGRLLGKHPVNYHPKLVELGLEFIVFGACHILLDRFDDVPLTFSLFSSARAWGTWLIPVALYLSPFALSAAQCLSSTLLLGRTEILLCLRFDTAIILRFALLLLRRRKLRRGVHDAVHPSRGW